jgi:uncharacterized membrane protein YsdA (DUF1294 family)
MTTMPVNFGRISGGIMKLFIAWLVAVNLLGALVTAYDKHCAQTGAWRIAERNLFLFCLFGGCPGVYLTMRCIHHKTRHKRFMLGIPLIFVAQIAIFLYIWYYKGSIYAFF